MLSGTDAAHHLINLSYLCRGCRGLQAPLKHWWWLVLLQQPHNCASRDWTFTATSVERCISIEAFAHRVSSNYWGFPCFLCITVLLLYKYNWIKLVFATIIHGVMYFLERRGFPLAVFPNKSYFFRVFLIVTSLNPDGVTLRTGDCWNVTYDRNRDKHYLLFHVWAKQQPHGVKNEARADGLLSLLQKWLFLHKLWNTQVYSRNN